MPDQPNTWSAQAVERAARVWCAEAWDAPNEGADCEPDDHDLAVARTALNAAMPDQPTAWYQRVRDEFTDPADDSADALVRSLLDDIDRLRAALAWYAQEHVYLVTQAREPRSAVHGDGGAKARAALGASDA